MADSNYGNNGKDLVQEVDEMKVKAESFWKENGTKVLAIGGILAGLILNKKINRLESRTGAAFKKTEKCFKALDEYNTKNFDAIFDNFKILRSDIVDIATFAGYQGKIRCNNVHVEE